MDKWMKNRVNEKMHDRMNEWLIKEKGENEK